jgi:hypothetical protein
MDFWKMIFRLVLKLEIRYIQLQYLQGFWFVLEEFFKITFLHGEIFEFPLFFFCLKMILFNANGKATVWHTPIIIVIVLFWDTNKFTIYISNCKVIKKKPLANALYMWILHSSRAPRNRKSHSFVSTIYCDEKFMDTIQYNVA